MTHDELLERIKRLDFNVIYEMSNISLQRLTDGFKESLVRNVISRGETNAEQRRIFSSLKNAYASYKKSTDGTWINLPIYEAYPEYFRDFQLVMECGDILTEMDSIPDDKDRKIKELEARIEELEKNQPEEMSEEEIDAIIDNDNVNNNMISLEKGSHYVKTGEEIEDPDDLEHLQARIKEMEAELKSRDDRILELEEENENLKKQLEECQNQNIEQPEVKNEDWIVELLSHLCYEDEQVAKDFLEKIRGLKDTEIADIVAEWVKDNKISLKSCRRDLWRILHAAKLYEGTESNYNTAMRQRQ